MGTVEDSRLQQHKYVACAKAIEQLIDKQKLKPNEKLPSIRQLSSLFGLSKNTVIHALHSLETTGQVAAKPKSGYVVKRVLDIKPPAEPIFDDIQPAKVAIPELLQDILMRGAAFDILPSEKPEPLPTLLAKLHRNINRNMRTQVVKKSLYYDNPIGHLGLREQIAERYRQRKLMISADNICITSGCQHALFLALSATCKPGDNVIIESPGFYGVIQLLDQLGLHAIEVPSKNLGGIDVGKVGEVLRQHKVSACVVSPAFATPSGSMMDADAKHRLVDLADTFDFALIEDDIYGDISFIGKPIPLKAYDDNNRVILCSSFSKSLSRDLRIGWIEGARWHKHIVRLKMVNQLASGQAVQAGVSDFLTEGDFSRYIAQRSQTLMKQRDQFVFALHQHFGKHASFVVPSGGLSIWLSLPEQVDTLALYKQVLQHKIVITPGALFSVEKDFSNYLRMSFCHPLTAGRENAIKVLSQLMRESIKS